MSTIDPETMPRCARTHGTPQLEALDSWATLLLAVARRQHDGFAFGDEFLRQFASV